MRVKRGRKSPEDFGPAQAIVFLARELRDEELEEHIAEAMRQAVIYYAELHRRLAAKRLAEARTLELRPRSAPERENR